MTIIDLVILIWVFVLGLIVGSFLNVVSLRLNTGRSLSGRSRCMNCNHRLYWYDLFPFFSFIYLRGKCRYCESELSLQYPLIELLTGVIFTLIFFVSGFPISIFYWTIWSILIVILIYDYFHKIIPNRLVYLFGLLSLAGLVLGWNPAGTASLWNILAGPVLALPFVFLWLVSRGRWMGLGDGKLALGIGWFLGLSIGISAIILSFWIGAFISLILVFTSKLNKGGKEFKMKSEVPFGPFMILGTFLAYLFSLDILGLTLIFGI